MSSMCFFYQRALCVYLGVNKEETKGAQKNKIKEETKKLEGKGEGKWG